MASPHAARSPEDVQLEESWQLAERCGTARKLVLRPFRESIGAPLAEPWQEPAVRTGGVSVCAEDSRVPGREEVASAGQEAAQVGRGPRVE